VLVLVPVHGPCDSTGAVYELSCIIDSVLVLAEMPLELADMEAVAEELPCIIVEAPDPRGVVVEPGPNVSDPVDMLAPEEVDPVPAVLTGAWTCPSEICETA